MAPSCYCEPKSRQHKWGLVLETIHFALVQKQLHPEPEKPAVEETATR
jgi:hypothetical protein